jgi:hypothetical protein
VCEHDIVDPVHEGDPCLVGEYRGDRGQ